MRHTLLYVFFLFSYLWSGAQVDDIILFQNFTNEDGLAQSSIRGFYQDETGFIWIATAEGLHRYDGYNFKVFRHDDRDTQSLTDNNITAIAADQDGMLWVGTETGHLDIFSREYLSFQHIDLYPGETVENKYPVTAIYHHPGGTTLIGLEGGGMISIDRKTHHTRRFTADKSLLPDNFLTCFAPYTGKNMVWVGTQKGMALFNPETNTFSRHEIPDLLSEYHISGVFHAITRLYITTRGEGLQVWDTETGELTAFPSPKIRNARYQTFIFMDTEGILWIGTDGGGVLKFTGDHFVSYRNQPYIPTSLVGDKAESGFTDRDGNIWFGLSNGISRYDKSLKVFNLVRDFQHHDTPVNNIVYCIYEDRDQNIWLGTQTGGMARFDRKTGELKVYPVIKTREIETRSVRSIYQDRSGKLWVGTRDEGLFSFDPESEEFTYYPTGDDIKISTIRHILEDKDGNLWLGTHWGLMLFDRSTNEFTPYKSAYLDNNKIYQIYEDKLRDELILVTFRSGLHIFHKKDKAFTVLMHNADSNSPNVNAMMCIEPIGNDSFLIGTYGGGVNLFDRKTLTFKSITTDDGLPNNIIYGILRNGTHEYWVSTNQGLSRFNLQTLEFKNFNLSHYLQGLEFNEGAYCKAQDGTFYFGGTNGFNFFNPNRLSLNMKPPPVALTAFKVMDKEIRFSRDILYLPEIEVSYRENLISFEYAALNFTNSRENHYAYKMEGYDDDWIYAGTRRTAYYTKLAPGTYTFRVKASNDNGIWNETGTSIRVVINPPFYLTSWFIVIVVVLAFLLILFIFRLRTKTIARSFEHQLTDMELRALRSQMNPHFIFNSLNSIQYFVLNKKPEEAYNYLTKFSNLMRMILQNSGLKYITLQAEHDWLKTYLELEKMRMENNFEFHIDIEAHINPSDILLPSMMVQPYVENAILHGLMHKEGDRRLSIQFKQANKMLICIVEDNGIGRQQSAEINMKRRVKHKSHGMKLTRDRLEIISRDHKQKPDLRITDLFDGEGRPSGTRVVITIPVARPHEIAELTKE